MKIKIKSTVTALLVVLASFSLQAQVFTLKPGASVVKVDGTSNLHDWDITSTSQFGKLKAEVSEGKLLEISLLEFELNPETLKSGKAAMDKNTYKALKTDKHKKIHFKLKKTNKIETVGTDTYRVSGVGSLSIAGTERNIDVSFNAKVFPGKIQISGSQKLKMTTYNVDPPKALMGTITTGDQVTVSFDSTFSK